MKIVMQYETGDDYTWWATDTIPIEYESTEAALCAFDDAVKLAYANDKGKFEFLGRKYSTWDFVKADTICLPDFLTVDEWFAGK